MDCLKYYGSKTSLKSHLKIKHARRMWRDDIPWSALFQSIYIRTTEQTDIGVEDHDR
jgi:hypothetical protein